MTIWTASSLALLRATASHASQIFLEQQAGLFSWHAAGTDSLHAHQPARRQTCLYATEGTVSLPSHDLH